jgi:hypothetical protein
MPKEIAVISYDLTPSSPLTADAVTILNTLNANGYSAQLVHQWSLDETNSSQFKLQRDWERYDGVVICNFYGFWNLRELIVAERPIVCLNSGYVDDLGLGESPQQHILDDQFNVVNASHPIVSNSGLAAGPINIGANVWTDSISTLNHHVDVLVTTLASRAVLLAHKSLPLVYCGWYRMSIATPGGPAFKLLLSAANSAFSGP